MTSLERRCLKTFLRRLNDVGKTSNVQKLFTHKDTITKKTNTTFGHVLRARGDYPQSQVSLIPGTANRLLEWKGRGRGKKETDKAFKWRSGKPRQNWLLTTKEAAWKDYSHLGYVSWSRQTTLVPAAYPSFKVLLPAWYAQCDHF